MSYGLKVIDHVLTTRLSYAATAATDHVDLAAFVPPDSVRAMLLAPFVSKLTRMFSMDCALKPPLSQPLVNAVEVKVPVPVSYTHQHLPMTTIVYFCVFAVSIITEDNCH